MKLVDDVFLLPFRGPVRFPPFRVRPSKLYRHTAPAVDSAGSCIRVRGPARLMANAHIVIVIRTVKTFLRPVHPYAFLSPFHGDGAHTAALVPIRVEMELHPVRDRTPQLKHSPVTAAGSTQIMAVIDVIFLKCAVRIEAFQLSCCHFLRRHSHSSAFLMLRYPFTAPDMPFT